VSLLFHPEIQPTLAQQSSRRRNERTGIIKADNEIAFPGQLEGEAPYRTARIEPYPAAGAQERGPLRVSPGGLLVSGKIGVVAPEIGRNHGRGLIRHPRWPGVVGRFWQQRGDALSNRILGPALWAAQGAVDHLTAVAVVGLDHQVCFGGQAAGANEEFRDL